MADAGGRAAEFAVAEYLRALSWRVLAQRLRTKAGEVDLVATRDGLLLLGEVKLRASHESASFALSPRQRERLLQAGALILAEHPDWGASGVRFDVFLVDHQGCIAQIEDAIRDM